MTFPDSPTMPAMGAIRDDTTRNLCAAAHLSPGFADSAIREFLTESTRAIPPSPGIDAPTVLREAVAARQRRLIRDWILLAILVALVIVNSTVAIFWAVLGVALCLGRAVRRGEPLAQLLASAVAPIGGLIGLYLMVKLIELTTAESGPSGRATPTPTVEIGVLAVVAALLALAVLVLDRLAVALLLHRSFQRGRFVPEPVTDSWPGERWVRTVGRDRYQFELARVAHVEAGGNLVAYRGYEPFVGAGTRLRPISIAISLDPAESGRHNGAGNARHPFTRPFMLRELYDHVTAQLLAMRDAPSLSPSGRLAWLAARDQVLVPVEDLLVNYDDPATRMALPDLGGPPRQTIPPEHLAEVIERPREWMRYYRCFSLETWNRELAVSGYLHFGASNRQLYLEWIPCLLLPIADGLRLPDTGPSVRPVRLALGALGDWLRLPGELMFRMVSLFRRIRPAATEQDVVVPEKYGTALSLRELAAGRVTQNYFQDSDTERYVELLSTRMLRSVGEFLEHKGISVTDFIRQATNIINNFGDNYGVNNFGSMNGDNYFGGPNAAGPSDRGPARPAGTPGGAKP